MPASSGKNPTTAPCKPMPRARVGVAGHAAISSEPPVTIDTDTRSTLRCPYRSPRRESSGVITAKASWERR